MIAAKLQNFSKEKMAYKAVLLSGHSFLVKLSGPFIKHYKSYDVTINAVMCESVAH